MANKDATITLSVDGADESRVDIEKVRKAVEDFGDEGVRIAGPVTNALNHIQGGWDKIADKIQNGKVVTQRDVALMVQQYAHLESAINQAFGSAANAPKELQDALKKAEAQVKSTTQTVAQMDDAVKDNAGNVKAAAGNWPGLGDAIEAVGGKFGSGAAQVAMYSAALQQGWQIGTQMATAMGTDFSAMEQAIDKFTSKAKTVNAAVLGWLSPGAGSFTDVAASMKLSRAEYEGYTSAMIAGIEGIKDVAKHTQEFSAIQAAHTVILAEGHEGQKLASQAKREGGGVLSEYTRALDMATEAAKVHAALTKAGAEGDQLWNIIREQGKGTLADLLTAIDAQSAAIKNLTTRTAEQAEADKKLADAVNSVSAARDKLLGLEIQQASLVANQEAVENGLTASMRTRLAEISASIVVKEGKEIPLTKLQVAQFAQMIDSTVGLTDAERKHLHGLADKLKTVEKLSQWERESIAREIQRQLLINTTTQADKDHEVVIDKKTRTISNAAAATDKLNDANIKITKSSGETLKAGDDLAAGFGKLDEKTKTVATGVSGIGKGLEDFVIKSKPTLDQIEKLVAALEKLNSAAGKAESSLARAATAGIEGSGGDAPVAESGSERKRTGATGSW